ncbi:MAG: secretion protein HlyD [Leptospirales bacterium]|nr:secretion protein HlyD [Leptospirales bacterium]
MQLSSILAKIRSLGYRALPLLLLPVGLLVFLLSRGCNDSPHFVVKRGDITESVYGLATVRANRVFNLRLGVPARIRKVHVNQGDEVNAGSPLIEFDELAAVRSPIRGVVTSLNYHVDEITFPQLSVLTVTDFGDRHLVVSLEEQGALKIRRGQKARVSFEGLRDVKPECNVKGIYPEDGQFQVRVQCNELPLQILPGMTADVLIEVANKTGVLLVPVAALRENRLSRRRGADYKEIEVKTGSHGDEMVEILSGDLQEGDRVTLPRI